MHSSGQLHMYVYTHVTDFRGDLPASIMLNMRAGK